MACSCSRKEVRRKETVAQKGAAVPAVDNGIEPKEQKTLPTEQCIACAQKHMDEAWCLFTEYGYGSENRRLVRGNLRAIVLHTYKEWKEIADLARECALLVQEARDDEAFEKMAMLCGMIDEEFYRVNPEVKERMEALKEE